MNNLEEFEMMMTIIEMMEEIKEVEEMMIIEGQVTVNMIGMK